MAKLNLLKRLLLPAIRYISKVRDSFVIPPYEEKRLIIKGYRDKYKLKILIETGTFFGDTIDQFKDDFDRLYSFELSSDLATKATARFMDRSNIRIINADSGKGMMPLLAEVNAPCLLWLDGHYSSEFYIGDEFIKTAKGEKETPIVEELTAILNDRIIKHVILIDDARCFNGNNDYPTLKQLKGIVWELDPKRKIEIKRDIIRITPA